MAAPERLQHMQAFRDPLVVLLVAAAATAAFAVLVSM
jgi:hypothetical protein